MPTSSELSADLHSRPYNALVPPPPLPLLLSAGNLFFSGYLCRRRENLDLSLHTQTGGLSDNFGTFLRRPAIAVASSFFRCCCHYSIYSLTLLPVNILLAREYWNIYRGPDFLAVVWFSSFPTISHLLSRQKARPASQRKTEKERQLDAGRGEGGGGGAKSYDGGKAWFSINRSILSAFGARTLCSITQPHNHNTCFQYGLQFR